MKKKNLIYDEAEYKNWLEKNGSFLKRYIQENLRVKVDCRRHGYISVSLWDGKNEIYEDDDIIDIKDNFGY